MQSPRVDHWIKFYDILRMLWSRVVLDEGKGNTNIVEYS